MKRVIYLMAGVLIFGCTPSNTKTPPSACTGSTPQLLCVNGYGLLPVNPTWGYDQNGRFHIDVTTDVNEIWFSTRFICDSYIQDSIPWVGNYVANDENQVSHPLSAWFISSNGKYYKEYEHQPYYNVRVDTSQANNFNVTNYNSSTKELDFVFTGYFKEELVVIPSLVFYADMVLNNVPFKP